MTYMKIVMNGNKSLYDISWQVSEKEYRSDKALSYSNLSKFIKLGFNGLSHIFDKDESPSLTFGSAVDSIITGGKKEFDERFLVAEFPSVRDSIVTIVKELFTDFKDKFCNIKDIPDSIVIDYATRNNFQSNWRPETRGKVVKEEGSEYYKLLYISEGKTILDTETYKNICNSVDSLRTSIATKWYFQPDNPWDNIERFYQLKFRAQLNGIWYRCMADLLIVDHNTKTIIPVDLKTSFKAEHDFYKSFIEWNYHIQARLYWRIIRKVLDSNPIFKDYKLEDYRFIVVCRTTLKPLVWGFDKTQVKGNITYGNINQVILPDPEDIGRELYTYLSENRSVPIGINEFELNDISYWLNKYYG